jgi:putative ABC transport system permease protein
MWMINLSFLTFKQIRRHPIRSLLTVLGVLTGMFLFAVVESMQQSLRLATEVTAKDNILVVYRENRFCPFTSRLPEAYEAKIAKIPGVAAVFPIQIIVNNCGTSLDVITFRGIPTAKIGEFSKSFQLLEGSIKEWESRSEAALIGQVMANRRRLKVGDKFEASGISVLVAGIIASDNPQNMNVGYLHLDYLQLASRRGLGSVTQFNVFLSDPGKSKEIAETIDAMFHSDQAPTDTRPEKAFVAQTISEVVTLIGFSRYVGWAAVITVLGLVANTILLSVRGQVKEYAVMQTLGYTRLHLSWMVLLEGMILGLTGGLAGIGLTALVMHLGKFTLSNDALSVVFATDTRTVIIGIAMSVSLGILAGIVPAWRVAHQDIVSNLRAES